jgi:hypothetical protein
MKSQFDFAMTWTWEEMSHLGISYFTKSHGKLLGMFVSSDDIAKVDGVGEDYHLVPTEIQRIMSSRVGKSMYGHAWLKVAWGLYVKKIEEQLANLEHNDFLLDEVESFKVLMLRESAALVASGHKLYDKKNASIEHLGQTLKLKLTCPNDEWSFRLAAKLKTVGVNSGVLKKLPWEDVICADGPIPGVAAHAKVLFVRVLLSMLCYVVVYCLVVQWGVLSRVRVSACRVRVHVECVEMCVTCAQAKVPAELLVESQNVREAVCKLMGDRHHTLSEMRRLINANAPALLVLERTFEIDLVFLNEKALFVLTKSVHDHILAVFPTEQVSRSFDMVSLIM